MYFFQIYWLLFFTPSGVHYFVKKADEMVELVVECQDGHAQEHADHPAYVSSQAPAVVGEELSSHGPRVQAFKLCCTSTRTSSVQKQ